MYSKAWLLYVFNAEWKIKLIVFKHLFYILYI